MSSLVWPSPRRLCHRFALLGYGLATLQFHYFLGASYLFIINSIYIAFATYIGVKLFKYKPVATVDADRAHRVMRIVYTLAILTMLPSIWLTYNMFRQNKFQVNSQRFVTEECLGFLPLKC